VEHAARFDRGAKAHDVPGPVGVVEDVEHPGVDDRGEGTAQPVEREHVGHLERGGEPSLGGLGPGEPHGGWRDIDAHDLQAARGEQQRVLAGATAAVEYRRVDLPSVGEADEGGLGSADVPRSRASLVHRVPGVECVGLAHDDNRIEAAGFFGGSTGNTGGVNNVDSVMVFAPVPRLTVTIEQPSDEPELHVHAGGQGVWQARMLALLEVPVTVCACLGGETGRVLVPLLTGEGVTLRTFGRDGSNGWYVHDRRDGDRALVAEAFAEPLNRHEIDELYGLALAEGLRAGVSVFSGTEHPSVLPADVYRRLATDLRHDGRRVIADLSGEQARAALEGGVAFLKISHEEAIQDGWATGDSDAELAEALSKLHEAGAAAVLISRAERRALALLDGEVVEVESPRLEVTDPSGAGDSMTAGIAAAMARGHDVHEAVRVGTAAAAVNVTRHGLGTGEAQTIAELKTRVRFHPLGSEEDK
jgi:1-phosphofructokinase